MNYEEIKYPGSNGQDTIFASLWSPGLQEPKGILQITHGMCEHMGRYEMFAQFMARNGFIVCGQDHIGHGRSAPDADALGFFAEKDGYIHLVDDIHGLYKVVSARFPDLPYFLFGHSMGSFITRQYITRYADGLSGHICCGTGGPNPILRIAVMLATRECRTKGPRSRGYHLNKLAFGAAYKRAGKKPTSASSQTSASVGADTAVPCRSYASHAWLSRDPAVWEQFGSDPQCNFVFTNSAFKDLFTLYRQVSRPVWASSIPKDLPFLLIAGDRDPVGNGGKGVKTVYQRLQKAGVKDLQIKLYEGARHELLNETNKSEVYQDILSWLTDRITN